MITRKIAPAIAAGCTIVIKPAEQTLLCEPALAELARRAAIPPSVINIAAAHAVIEQFIDFARLGSDEAECLCDINELVSNVAATSSYSHMRLELGTLAPYACRPVAMRRAISNLVENALRYGPAKADAESAIIVRTGIDANAISAMDNGPGILPADMERIRHPFIRLDEARRKQAGCSKSPLNGDATAKSTNAIFTPAD